MHALPTIEAYGSAPPPQPAGRCSLGDTVDEATDVVSRNIYPHRLRVADTGGRSLMCLTSALDLGDCALGYVQYGFEVEIDSGVIAEYQLVKSTLAGQGRVICGTRVRDHVAPLDCHDLDDRGVARHHVGGMPAPDGPRLPQSSRAADRGKAGAPLERATEIRHGSPLGFGFRPGVASAPGPHLRPVGHRAQGAGRRGSSQTVLAHHDRAAGARGAAQLFRRAGARAAKQAIPWYVRRARAYMHDHLSDLRSVAEIAGAVGITPRSLQNGFRRVFNMTPAEYLRDIRIQALHESLLRADPGRSVTELMQDVGIVNFGRYAQYYRRKMGVAPSETLRGAVPEASSLRTGNGRPARVARQFFPIPYRGFAWRLALLDLPSKIARASTWSAIAMPRITMKALAGLSASVCLG